MNDVVHANDASILGHDMPTSHMGAIEGDAASGINGHGFTRETDVARL